MNVYLTVDSVVKQSQQMNKISYISVCDIDIQTIGFVQNRVSIFFHKFFRINVELNFDLKL